MKSFISKTWFWLSTEMIFSSWYLKIHWFPWDYVDIGFCRNVFEFITLKQGYRASYLLPYYLLCPRVVVSNVSVESSLCRAPSYSMLYGKAVFRLCLALCYSVLLSSGLLWVAPFWVCTSKLPAFAQHNHKAQTDE